MKSLILSVFCLVSSLSSAAAMAKNDPFVTCHGVHGDLIVRIEKNTDYQEPDLSHSTYGSFEDYGDELSFSYNVSITKTYLSEAMRVMKYKLKATGSLAADNAGVLKLYPYTAGSGTGMMGAAPVSSGRFTITPCELDGKCDRFRGVLEEAGLLGVEMHCRSGR